MEEVKNIAMRISDRKSHAFVAHIIQFTENSTNTPNLKKIETSR
jgi:hypothetical protein